MNNELEILIGKVIEGIRMPEDGERIDFKTNKGEFCFRSEAECCSRSWIESLDGVEEVIGHEVTGVVEKFESRPARQKDEEDYCFESNDLKIYSYDIVTAKGACAIDFRNESNGYYGGELKLLCMKCHKNDSGGWNEDKWQPFEMCVECKNIQKDKT